MSIKHLIIIATTSILSINPTLTFADSASTLGSKPVAYKSCSKFPDSITFSEKPQHCMNGDGQSVISFFIKGENLVGPKEDSVKATTLTLNGKDISKNRMGKPTYKLGSFPKTTEDGKFISLDIEIKDTGFTKAQDIKFSGTVDILTSENLIDLSQEVDTSKPFEIKLGSYVITNKDKISIDGAIGSAIGSMMSPNSDDKSLSIKIMGDLEALISLEMTEGDKKVNRSWSSWHENIKTISFSTPSQPNVSLKLKYWDKLKQETVSLSF